MRKKNRILNLQKEFRFSYTYTEFLYNNIVTMYNACLDNKIFTQDVKFRNKKHLKEFENDNGEFDIYNWLKANNYDVELYLLINKQVIQALIYDFITHISQVLHNILEGNLSIAYILLRKPIKETLTLFESIIVDPFKFNLIFTTNNPKNYNPNRISKEIKLSNIEKVISLTNFKELYSLEMLYDLRFNKGFNASYDKLWNKAIHLITDYTHIETEKMNINFVFSNKDDKYDQLAHIFSTLPPILFYSVEVIKILLNCISIQGDHSKADLKMLVGYYLWASETFLKKTTIKKISGIFNDGFKEICCINCKQPFKYNKMFFKYYFYHDLFICKNCKFIYMEEDLDFSILT